jgi:hypothetical protein
MKYKVGDLILIKNIDPHLGVPPHRRPRLHLHLRLRPRLRLHPRLHPFLQNTYGIITATEKHTDIFEKDSTENNNGYVWFSQVDQSEYHFYEDEVEGEVVK